MIPFASKTPPPFPGSIIIGLLYRERNEENSYREKTPDFDPGNGYDTSAGKSRKRDEEEGEKCIICYDTIKRSHLIRVLQCAHRFHRRCINNWLRYEQFCPLCKTVVV